MDIITSSQSKPSTAAAATSFQQPPPHLSTPRTIRVRLLMRSATDRTKRRATWLSPPFVVPLLACHVVSPHVDGDEQQVAEKGGGGGGPNPSEGRASRQREETFRSLCQRVRELLEADGSFKLLTDSPDEVNLEHYTRFMSATGDVVYLLDAPVETCLRESNESELHFMPEQDFKLQLVGKRRCIRAEEEEEEEEYSEDERPSSGRYFTLEDTSPTNDTAPSKGHLPSTLSLQPPKFLQQQPRPPTIPDPVMIPQRKQQADDLSARASSLTTTTTAHPRIATADTLPSKRGLVVHDATGSIDNFMEEIMSQIDSTASPLHSTTSGPQLHPTRSVSSPSSLPALTTSLSSPAPSMPTPAFGFPPPTSSAVAGSMRDPIRTSPSPASATTMKTYMDTGLATKSRDSMMLAGKHLPCSIENAKNEVQSYFQTRFGPRVAPEYVLDASDGTGFYVSLDVSKLTDGATLIGRGMSSKRKDAEKLAAFDAIIKLMQTGKFGSSTDTDTASEYENPKTQLNELFHALWRTSPVYTYAIDQATGGFTAELRIGDQVLRATGTSKPKASAAVAEQALRYLKASSRSRVI